MHHVTVERYRRLLFLSAVEAARNVARTEQRPEGVSEKSWKRWEAGEARIPEPVADNLRKLVAQRQVVLDSLTDHYTPIADKRDIVAYRVSQSVAAQAAAMGITINDTHNDG